MRAVALHLADHAAGHGVDAALVKEGGLGALKPSGPSQAAEETGRTTLQFTRALRLFRGSTRTFFDAGFALNIIFSLVKGLMP